MIELLVGIVAVVLIFATVAGIAFLCEIEPKTAMFFGFLVYLGGGLMLCWMFGYAILQIVNAT